MSTDRLTSALLGFRTWDITGAGLESHARTGCWTPGVNTATCKPYRSGIVVDSVGVKFIMNFGPSVTLAKHEAPHAGCSCGLYAWHDLDELRQNHVSADGSIEPGVYGAVAGWGRSYAHKQGWRAQHARILALAVVGDDPLTRRIVDLLADHYAVPVVPLEMLQLEGAQHAEVIPRELRGPPPEPVVNSNVLYDAWGQPTTRNLFAGVHQAWDPSAFLDEEPRPDVPQSPASRFAARHAPSAPSRPKRAPKRTRNTGRP